MLANDNNFDHFNNIVSQGHRQGKAKQAFFIKSTWLFLLNCTFKLLLAMYLFSQQFQLVVSPFSAF